MIIQSCPQLYNITDTKDNVIDSDVCQEKFKPCCTIDCELKKIIRKHKKELPKEFLNDMGIED